ncbi:hypothetical protein A6U92_03175 [Agrobacterium rubi]|nr:hypothetical protein A6U92_03175 [Agrobacterium rubi]
MRDEPLPLFAAAADREQKSIAEQAEPEVELRQMTEGHNVVTDYGHVGLTLREHPMAFLRESLAKRSMVTCEDAMSARDGRWVYTPGLVLVRQKPGSAKGACSSRSRTRQVLRMSSAGRVSLRSGAGLCSDQA